MENAIQFKAQVIITIKARKNSLFVKGEIDKYSDSVWSYDRVKLA